MARSRHARTRSKRSRKKRSGGTNLYATQAQWNNLFRHTGKSIKKNPGPIAGFLASIGGRKRRTSKKSRKKRGGQRVTADCVRIKQPGMLGPLIKLDANHNPASCPKSQNCMMIDREGNVSEECASAAARKVPGATIVGKCQPGNNCGLASRGFLGGRKRRKTKRKKGGSPLFTGFHNFGKNWNAMLHDDSPTENAIKNNPKAAGMFLGMATGGGVHCPDKACPWNFKKFF